MAFTWLSQLLSVTATVQQAVQSVTGFGVLAYVSDVSLDGDRTRTYTSVAGATTDFDAGYLDSDTLSAITEAFAQSPRPSSMMVIRAEVSGAETYVDGLNAAEADGALFYAVTISSRTASDHVAVDAWVAARRKIALYQSADSDWLTSGVPSGYSSITSSVASGVVYHPTSTEHADVAALARAMALDPVGAGQAPSFVGPLLSIASYTVTSAQATFALANSCNLLGPYQTGGASVVFRPGTVLSGEYLYATYAKHWTEAYIETYLLGLFSQYDSAGTKFPANDAGLRAIVAQCGRVGKLGLDVGHFTRRADLPDGYEFSAVLASSTAVTVTGNVGLLDAIQSISVTVNLTRAS